MIALNHVLAGAAIGLAVRDPLLAAPLAFISHFVLDAFPHYDYGGKSLAHTFWRIWAVDAMACIAVLAAFILNNPDSVGAAIAGGICAELPDTQWLLTKKNSRPGPLRRFHTWIQWSESPSGLFYELGYLVLLATLNIALLTR